MSTELITTKQMIELRPIGHSVECTECDGEIPSMEVFYTESYRQKVILCKKCYEAQKKWEAVP